MRSITTALLLVASIASAQQPAPAPKPIPKATSVDFTVTPITGEFQVPLGTIYLAPLKRRFDSLIRVRMNMNDKLAASVHEM